MNSDEFIFPKCETIEKKEDKRIWYWEDCIEVARKSGAKMGTLEFWTVYRYRVYETHGRYGFCVAGFETLAADLGVSVEQMKTAHQNLCRGGDWGDGRNVKPKLYHIWCDKKVYRNKTKIYVTEQWLKDRGLTAEQIKVLSHGRNNTHKLTGKIGENGEIIEAKIVENKLEATCEYVEATCEYVEATCEYVEATCEYVESPLMNKYKNMYKGISINESTVTNVTEQMPIKARNDDISPYEQSTRKSIQLPFPLEEDVNQTSDQKQITSSANNLSHKPNPPSSAAPPSRKKVNEKELWEQEFEELWKLYPRKESKANGLKAYLKARKKGVSKETILEALKRYKRKVESEHTERKYIIKGGNWFSGERWEDEAEPTDKGNANEESGNILDLMSRIH